MPCAAGSSTVTDCDRTMIVWLMYGSLSPCFPHTKTLLMHSGAKFFLRGVGGGLGTAASFPYIIINMQKRGKYTVKLTGSIFIAPKGLLCRDVRKNMFVSPSIHPSIHPTVRNEIG